MVWSPELLIASHDDDEQNARLAQHLWEDNGLDIPETFLPELVPFLSAYSNCSVTGRSSQFPGHENSYVRTSTPRAIAEGVEHWPTSIENVLLSLQEFYREKVVQLDESWHRG